LTRRVFISRKLDADSLFYQILSKAGVDTFGISLVGFMGLPFSAPPLADWVFFYSSRSAAFFLRGLSRLGYPTDRYAHYAALGKGTARSLQDLGITPAFIGDGSPKSTALAFLEKAEGQRVLFPRAKQSRQSVQRLLAGKLEMLDLVVYQNLILKNPKIPDTEYVVLTSPLNAHAYTLERKFSPDQRIVAIGQTTAGMLLELGISNFRIADQPTEEALAAAVLQWEKS
jgi:uroporphyrinogen-III synthase